MLNYFCCGYTTLRSTKFNPGKSKYVWACLGTPGPTQPAAVVLHAILPWLLMQRFFLPNPEILVIKESCNLTRQNHILVIVLKIRSTKLTGKKALVYLEIIFVLIFFPWEYPQNYLMGPLVSLAKFGHGWAYLDTLN